MIQQEKIQVKKIETDVANHVQHFLKGMKNDGKFVAVNLAYIFLYLLPSIR